MARFTLFVLATCLVALVLAADRLSDPPCQGYCTPGIDPHTVIEPVPGLRATADIVPTYGDCSVLYRGYRWYISWGDGISSFNDTAVLMPAQQLYTYKAPGKYNVTVSYCARPIYCCENCASVYQVITVQ